MTNWARTEAGKAYRRKWYLENVDRIREYHRKYYASSAERRERLTKKHRDHLQKTKLLVFEHYGGKCVCCGEKEPKFLTLDHKNNDGFLHRKNVRKNMYYWAKVNGFPDILQILCMNCNCAKAWFGSCPHGDA